MKLTLLQQLFTLFLIVLLMVQTPKQNWLTKNLYDTGYFGTYRNVQRTLFAITLGSIFLFFSSNYSARTPAPGATPARRAGVAHESPNKQPNGLWIGGPGERQNEQSLEEQGAQKQEGLEDQDKEDRSNGQD